MRFLQTSFFRLYLSLENICHKVILVTDFVILFYGYIGFLGLSRTNWPLYHSVCSTDLLIHWLILLVPIHCLSTSNSYLFCVSIGESENSICMTNSGHKIIQICMICCTISSTILLYSPVPSFQNYQFQDASALFVIITPIKTYFVIVLSITSMTAEWL